MRVDQKSRRDGHPLICRINCWVSQICGDVLESAHPNECVHMYLSISLSLCLSICICRLYIYIFIYLYNIYIYIYFYLFIYVWDSRAQYSFGLDGNRVLLDLIADYHLITFQDFSHKSGSLGISPIPNKHKEHSLLNKQFVGFCWRRYIYIYYKDISIIPIFHNFLYFFWFPMTWERQNHQLRRLQSFESGFGA